MNKLTFGILGLIAAAVMVAGASRQTPSATSQPTPAAQTPGKETVNLTIKLVNSKCVVSGVEPIETFWGHTVQWKITGTCGENKMLTVGDFRFDGKDADPIEMATPVPARNDAVLKVTVKSKGGALQPGSYKYHVKVDNQPLPHGAAPGLSAGDFAFSICPSWPCPTIKPPHH